MEINFEKSFEFMLGEEGGFSNDPHDPGGPTRFGITMATLGRWLGYEVSADEVRRLTREDVWPIYHAWYWNVNRCQDLPAGLDLLVFDFGVNSGARSAKIIQGVVGTAQDGVIGPKTLGAIRAFDTRWVIEETSEEIERWYRTLETFQYFGKGWLARNDRRKTLALSMWEQ